MQLPKIANSLVPFSGAEGCPFRMLHEPCLTHPMVPVLAEVRERAWGPCDGSLTVAGPSLTAFNTGRSPMRSDPPTHPPTPPPPAPASSSSLTSPQPLAGPAGRRAPGGRGVGVPAVQVQRVQRSPYGAAWPGGPRRMVGVGICAGRTCSTFRGTRVWYLYPFPAPRYGTQVPYFDLGWGIPPSPTPARLHTLICRLPRCSAPIGIYRSRHCAGLLTASWQLGLPL
jgi:hypothetical protein